MNNYQRTKTHHPETPTVDERLAERRRVKIDRLLASVVNETTEQLKAYGSQRRRAFGGAAGVNSPSDETWDEFIKALHARTRVWADNVNGDPFAGLPS